MAEEKMVLKEAMEIISNPKDKDMFKAIEQMTEKFYPGQSRIQIEKFILKEPEFPTDYGKYVQVKHELYARYHNIVTHYFDLKESEVKLEWRAKEAMDNPDTEKGELAELEAQKLKLKIASIKGNLNHVLYETRIFFELYTKFSKFHNMNEQELFKFEAEDWAKKALGNPLVFEERYGGELLEQLWGKENYEAFKVIRSKLIGPLHRELTNKIEPHVSLQPPKETKRINDK